MSPNDLFPQILLDGSFLGLGQPPHIHDLDQHSAEDLRDTLCISLDVSVSPLSLFADHSYLVLCPENAGGMGLPGLQTLSSTMEACLHGFLLLCLVFNILSTQ